LDLAIPETGPDPFKELPLCALDRHRGAIQAGQWPDPTGSLEANTEPLAPVREQRQAVEVGNCSQNQIGRIALDDDPGLVGFGTELSGDHYQVSNWALPPGYRQGPTIYRRALAKVDHMRLQILAANSDRFFSEDCRPKRRDLNISTERRK
jgi:hypothetical protein